MKAMDDGVIVSIECIAQLLLLFSIILHVWLQVLNQSVVLSASEIQANHDFNKLVQVVYIVYTRKVYNKREHGA